MSERSRNAGRAAGSAARGAAKLARAAVRSTKRAGRAAKLKVDIAAEKDTIKRLHTDIGRLYYEAHRDDPEGFFVQLFQQVEASEEAIEAMQAELDVIRAERENGEAGIEIEIEIVPDDEPGESAGETESAEADADAEVPDEAEKIPGSGIGDESEIEE